MKTLLKIGFKAFIVGILFSITIGCQRDPVTLIQTETHSKQTTAVAAKVPKLDKTQGKTTKKTVSSHSEPSTNQKMSKSSSAQSSQSKTSNSSSTTSLAKTKNSTTKTTNSTTNNKTTPAPKPSAATETVTMSIVGLNNAGILAPTKVPCTKGETFIQETLDIVKKKNMQITVKYSGNYVSSIDNLSERQHGPMSGWIAELNGVKLTKGAGVTTVSPGDRLEWVYTTTGE